MLVVAIVVLATACSPSADEDATTTSTTGTIAQAGGGDATTSTSNGSSSTPTTSATTTTTTIAATTTTRATTTTTTAPTTTTTIPADNEPPTVQITAPGALTAHVAAYDTDQEDFGAYLDLAATASDPNGDPVEVRWSASTQGFLGTGTSLTAWFSTRGSDATQPVITATAVDRWGTSTSQSIQIIVWIPSDT